jgi:hypothetical protein
MVGESLQWRTELWYRCAYLTVEGRGYPHVQARWLLMGEAFGDRGRKVVHVIGHADAQYSSAKLQGMCFMCTVPSGIGRVEMI